MAMVISTFMLLDEDDEDLEGEGHGVPTKSPQRSLFPEDFNDKVWIRGHVRQGPKMNTLRINYRAVWLANVNANVNEIELPWDHKQ